MKTRRSLREFKSVCVMMALVFLVGVASCSSGADFKALPIGSAMPNFTLKDVDGQAHSLDAYKGKIVVLDFSSIECPYSRGVDAALLDLAKTYGDSEPEYTAADLRP